MQELQYTLCSIGIYTHCYLLSLLVFYNIWILVHSDCPALAQYSWLKQVYIYITNCSQMKTSLYCASLHWVPKCTLVPFFPQSSNLISPFCARVWCIIAFIAFGGEFEYIFLHNTTQYMNIRDLIGRLGSGWDHVKLSSYTMHFPFPQVQGQEVRYIEVSLYYIFSNPI